MSNGDAVLSGGLTGVIPINQNQRVRTRLSILAGLTIALLVATFADVGPLTSHVGSFVHTSAHAPQHGSAHNGSRDAARISGDAVLPASVERSTSRSITAVAPDALSRRADTSTGRIALDAGRLTRPFDPSHLHTFPLLI